MFCPNCGAEIPDDAVFCGNCGKNILEEESKKENKRHIDSKSKSKLVTILLIAVILVLSVTAVFLMTDAKNLFTNKSHIEKTTL